MGIRATNNETAPRKAGVSKNCCFSNNSLFVILLTKVLTVVLTDSGNGKLTAAWLDIAKYKPIKTTAKPTQFEQVNFSENITRAKMPLNTGSKRCTKETTTEENLARL
ncbi:hypothetical protein ANSO36C_42900 [Nostoc cf. commune SO-36]|uniref:Uncharacterized protein n=1 Tax=Nostoc cf. commune SO-36 TaxID=449208 RepID=A0ABM7Z5X7_NOSCO|nr:hypothetical protein ANSO36C_42900 [Nostoc cf. commune SO-36]